MHRDLRIIIVLVMICIMSCSLDTRTSQDDEMLAKLESVLIVVDSIGSEQDDSLIFFGIVSDFTYHPDGSVLILDTALMCVHVIRENCLSYMFGKEGNGPGEFQSPTAFCAVSDGRILVADEYKREVMSFDINGNYLGAYFQSEGLVPNKMYPVDSSAIVAGIFSFSHIENESYFVYTVGRFFESSEPSVVYFTQNWLSHTSEVYSESSLLNFFGSESGRVYLVPDNTQYRVQVYSYEGELLSIIEMDNIPLLKKAEEEIEEEIRAFEESRRNDRLYVGGYTPYPFKTLIGIVGEDSEGNIWIARFDQLPDWRFDLWNGATGNYEYSVHLDREDDFPVSRLGVYADGILASTDNIDLSEKLLFLIEVDIATD